MAAVLVSSYWPVAGDYAVVEDGDRRWLEPRGSRFVRHLSPERLGDIRVLRKGSEPEILEWAKHNGMPGGLSHWAALGDGSWDNRESIEDIRFQALMHATCEAAIVALRLGGPPRHFRRLARVLRGAGPRPAAMIAEEVGLLPVTGPEPEPLPRRSLGPDLELLDAVGFAVGLALEASGRVGAQVRATRYSVQLTPTIQANGPLALAFARLLREIAGVRFNRSNRGPRLMWRQVRRQCRGCELDFVPDKPNQWFHDRRCQWRFSQRERRKTKQTPKPERERR